MNLSLSLHSRMAKTIVWITIIILAALIAMYCYSYFFSQKLALKQPIPDAIITDMDLIKTDQSGIMVYRSLSSKTYHYPAQNRSEFNSPRGYYYTKQQPYWKLTADHGKALQGDALLHLLGHVYIHQNAGKNNHEVTLTTSEATLYPQKRIAENNVFVKITEPGMVVTSVGFHANMKLGKVVLLSKVRGHFIKK